MAEEQASRRRVVEVKKHSEIGAEVLMRLATSLDPAAAIIRSHHERWAGTGYPDGLAGTDIPASARIIAIADTRDAITERRGGAPRALDLDQDVLEIHLIARWRCRDDHHLFDE